MIAPFQGVGFDLDGTLVDSLGFSAEWIASAATRAAGHEVTEKEVRRHFGRPEPLIFRALFAGAKADEAFGYYRELLAAQVSRIRLFDQARETLELLRAKRIPAALFTTRGRWAADQILAHHGLREFFAFTLAGDEVARLKPDPEGILRMCEALGVRPAAFVYVGDSDFDVMAAHRAGARAYQAVWAEGVQPYGDAPLKSLADLRAAIDRGRP